MRGALKLSQGFTHLLGGESFQIQYPLVGNREGSNLWLFRLLPTTITNGIGELQGCTPLKEAISQGVIYRKFSYTLGAQRRTKLQTLISKELLQVRLVRNNHIISMNKLIIVAIPKYCSDFLGAFSLNKSGFVRIVIGKPSSDLLATGIFTAH